EMDARVLGKAGRFEGSDLVGQDDTALRIFVAQIDVDVGRLDGPGADQHAFEKTMRIAFEIDAILERAGLALIGIDRHEPRLGLGAHEAPFAPGGKASPAKAAQLRILELLQEIVE